MKTCFAKFLNIKFYENPFSGSRVVSCGLKDRWTDMKKLIRSCFSQFCERA